MVVMGVGEPSLGECTRCARVGPVAEMKQWVGDSDFALAEKLCNGCIEDTMLTFLKVFAELMQKGECDD